MGYRNIFISSNARISSENEQLIISQNEQHLIPLEDINCIMIENLHSLITSYCFYKFSEYKIAVYFCNDKHIPCSVVLPYQSHTRHNEVLNYQINISKPTQKKLWQDIIKRKIQNQAKCFTLLGSDENYLYSLERKVLSGDTTNVEAVAAAYYFKSLFGNEFKRRVDSNINAALNYGYAIIRGFIARTLVCHGLETSIGLFHSSNINSFNLADDFIEPFRPFVDYYIMQKTDILNKDFTQFDKKKIFEMVSYCISINNQEHTVANAVDIMICSYIRVLKNESKILLLPKLIELKQYEYK